jgi:GH15 family glucan-1,4-alpha-glucosidase
VAAEADAVAADRLAATVRARFGPGYPRRPGGARRDAAITFLLPPFVEGTPDPALLGAWRAVQLEARRPAGGLAPGAGWKEDGVSWTPETALFALTAAATGDRPTARRWLTWLAAHRTTEGALPEKVLADGTPAAVAPLAWTAASVVLTAATLDATAPGGSSPSPATPDAVVPAAAGPAVADRGPLTAVRSTRDL